MGPDIVRSREVGVEVGCRARDRRPAAGEGGGWDGEEGAKSTVAILRALAGVVYKAGFNLVPRSSLSLISWASTSGLDATRYEVMGPSLSIT